MSERPDTHDVEFLLCQYLDDQLSRRQRQALETRLAEEPELREQLRKYQTLDDHLADLGDETPVGMDFDSMRTDVLAAVERKIIMQGPPKRRPWIIRLGVGAAAAAAILLAVVSVVFLMPGGGEETSSQPVASSDMLRAEGSGGGEGQASASVREMGWEELSLSAEIDETTMDEDVPSGTIILSIGSEQTPEDIHGGMPVMME